MTLELTRRGLLGSAVAAPLLLAPPAVRALAAAAPEAGRPPAFPSVDFDGLARQMSRTLAPAAGERAILAFDPGYYPELAAAVERQFASAGIEAFLAMAFDPPEVVAAADARPGAAKRQDDFVAWLAPVFAKAELFLWLPVRSLYGDTRFEHLVDGSKVRGIHFHWVLDWEDRTPEDIARLSNLYEKAILETDYTALSHTQDRLIGLLRGKTVRLTSRGGTDVRFLVPADAWFHKNDGDMSAARAKTARGARDREMELPAGALRFIPDPASAEGRLVIRSAGTPDGPVEDAAIAFAGGRGRIVGAKKGEDAFRKHWEAVGGDVDRVGEIVIGTNPMLAAGGSATDLPYFGYGAGAVRVSLGDNWESGGPNRTPGNRNWWLFLGDATLEADGRQIIREGRLVGG
jgi:hypothetical protein